MFTLNQTNPTVRLPFEQLPLQDRLKAADQFEFWKAIKPGMLVDAKDTINAWCVAEIIEQGGNDIRVSYDGWIQRYDMVLFKFDEIELRNWR